MQAAEDRQQHRQGVDLNLAADERGREYVINEAHHRGPPDGEASGRHRGAFHQQVDHRRYNGEAGAQPGDERDDDGHRPPQHRGWYAEDGKADAGEHTLDDRHQQRPLDDRDDGAVDLVEDTLVVAIRQRADAHQILPPLRAILKAVVEGEEEDEQLQQGGGGARQPAARAADGVLDDLPQGLVEGADVRIAGRGGGPEEALLQGDEAFEETADRVALRQLAQQLLRLVHGDGAKDHQRQQHRGHHRHGGE